jgi:DNA polymerase III epsilon subunit-like protein
VLGKLPDKTKEATHLTDADLTDQPTFVQVSNRVRNLLHQSMVDIVVGHHLSFDMEMIDLEMERLKLELPWPSTRICTIEQTTHHFGRRMKLGELYQALIGEDHKDAHRAMGDVDATLACLIEMRKREWL